MNVQSKKKRPRRPVYAVVRVDIWDGDESMLLSELRVEPQRFVTVAAVYPTLDEAKADVERLNQAQSRESGGSGSVYFWTTTRTFE